MATTNNTNAPLNHGYEDGHYTNIAVVTTGNMKDSKGKVVNNKYVTGRLFNDTYTLEANEEGGFLSDSRRSISYLGAEIDGGLDSKTWYAVWGMPNKWIYDTSQRYGNCGVDSCLNILSMAGVKDIIEFDKSEMDAVIAAHTTHTTDATGQSVERVPHISFVETEQEFTLWAIQNDYCDHWGDNYNSVADIIDGIDGGTYFGDVGGEHHDYHETIAAINTILTVNGVPSSIKHSYVKLNLGSDVEEISYVDGQPPEGEDASNDMFTISSNSGNVTITSNDGTDCLKFTDLNWEDLESNPYLFSKDGDDLYINYSDANTVVIKNFYSDSNHLDTVKFANGDSQSLYDLAEEHGTYGEDYVNSNIRHFGSFITELAEEVMLGHGVILQGMAQALNGVEVDDWDKGPNHAISLVGVVMDYNLEVPDIVGFYVVDTGGWLPNVGGAQFISVEKLHQFITSTLESSDTCTYIQTNYVATDENIRAWADDLNLIGNDKKNTLRGNIGNNKIFGMKGNDILYGLDGNDTLNGGDNNDTLYGGTGDNYLYGGNGNDSYVFDAGVDCRDVVIPGSGKDLIRFENYTKDELTFGNNNGDLVISYNNDQGSVTIKDYFSKSLYDNIYKLDDKDSIELTAANNEAWGANAYDFYRDIITQVEIQYDKYVKQNETNNIVGTKLRDSILGAQYADTISAGAGNDTINGGGGNDIIKAGADNDTIYGSYGSDKIYGEGGKNYIIYNSNYGYGGNDTIYSGSGEDHIVMTNKTREGLIFTRSGKDLVIIYDEDAGSSVTVQNYFGNNGNTSIKDILLSDGNSGNDKLDLVKEFGYISSRIVGNINGYNSVGGYGNDTLLGGAGADNMSGGLGDDVIKAGDGNDTINGGYGNDKLYGGNGDNTFVFTPNSGSDTIYAGGNGQINIDLSGTGIVLNGDKSGFEGSTIKDYAFTRTGNDLIINYAMDPSQEGTSTIVLQKYFKSKNSYNLITNNGTVSLNDVMMIYRGRNDKSNKIKGTKQGDIIFGGDLKDTIKGGDGNDSIAGGLGNDAITGGKGHNTVVYNLGDGKDTITLTKNEQLDIKINGNGISASDLSYRIYKGNLIISCNGEDILVLKKFGKKDVTTAEGGVDLYLNDAHLYDLRNDIFLPTYDAFTSKKYKYKGKWLAERIDASGLQSATNKKGRGVSINGAGGNDDIIGSDYNDTLKGGDGNDTLTGGYGKNTYDGGKGSDTYNLFTSSNDITNCETAIIKDTGKDGAVDIVNIDKDYDNLSVWFNIDRNRNASYVFNITDESTGDSATVSGVEQINANDGYSYDYTNAALLNEVANWLADNNFSDVATAMNQAPANQIDELMAYFNSDNYWTQA